MIRLILSSGRVLISSKQSPQTILSSGKSILDLLCYFLAYYAFYAVIGQVDNRHTLQPIGTIYYRALVIDTAKLEDVVGGTNVSV